MAIDQDRRAVRGALLLSACGDALGVPFDGASRVSPTSVDAVLAASDPLREGDCTAATVVVAEHIARRDGAVEPAVLGSELAARRASAIDTRADAARAALWAPVRPRLSGRTLALSPAVAAVSTLPLGLVAGLEPAEAAQRARRIAAVTHPDPLVGESAALIAVAVAIAAGSPQSGPFEPEPFVRQLATHASLPAVQHALARVPGLVETLAAPPRVAGALGADRSPVQAVLVAVTAFLRHGQSPWSAVRFAICVGGATAATAAAAGALCGAHLGDQLVPPQWMERLGRAVRIRSAASALA